MALAHSPKIVTDGLSLYLDSANPKSYDSTENLLTNSQKIDLWSPVAANLVRTPNAALAPDGTLTAEKLNISADGTSSYVQQFIDLEAGKTYTFSVYARSPNMAANRGFALRLRNNANTSDIKANFRLDVPNAGTPSIVASDFSNASTRMNYVSESLDGNANGWYRAEMSFTVTTALTSALIEIWYSGYLSGLTTDGDLYVWGAQLEQKSEAGYYTATETTTKTASSNWLSLNGSSNVGTPSPAPNFSTSFGGTFIFDGVDDYIQLNSTVTALSTAYTISSWINIDDFVTGKTSTGRTFIRLTGADFNNMIAFYNGGYAFETATNSNPHEISGRTTGADLSSAIAPGLWFHFCLIFDANIAYGYVNGTLCGAPIITNSLQFNRIGDGSNFAASYPAYFKGKISNFMTYNRALSQVEVKQNFNAHKRRYGL